MKPQVLVTGAGGFIGSHLCEALVRAGCAVRAFVHYNALNSWGWLESLPAEIRAELDVFAGDVRDPFGVAQAVSGCQQVFHLAALIAIPYSYHSPATYVETNITGTLNLLQAARTAGVERLLQTSTSEVYGTARQVPIDEEHPLQGQSPYSATKIGADQLALSFFRSFELPVTVVRPFNTYGPRQSARAIIPTIITQLAAGVRQIQLGALHPTRDFNFVSDTVAGFLAAAAAPAAVGEVINLGSGFEISMGQTAELIAEVMGVALEIHCDSARLRPDASEVERLLADNRKARRLLNWQPRYAGLEGLRAGLRETVAWFRDPAHLQAYKPLRYTL